MALNHIFIFFFLSSFVSALLRLIFFNDFEVFPEMGTVIIEMAKTGFELSLNLTGVLVFFMGLMSVGEKGGAVRILSRIMSPFFSIIFPGIPKGHKSFGSMMMNFSSNMLGLDNAATPMGLQAIKELQELNPDKNTATNEQIMFLVLNTSGLTIIPVSIIALRASSNAANPTDIFIPILLTTFFSTLGGLIITSIIQKINLFNKIVFLYLGSAVAMIVALVFYINSIDYANREVFSNNLSSIILLIIICGFIGLASYRKLNVYDSFIEGAKDGFGVAIKIIPYLVAILVAIGLFRVSGCMGYITDFFRLIFGDAAFIDALPTAIMKPLSGGGARGAMVETWNAFGVDSFAGKLAAIFQGSTETTFYVLALYFGSISVRNTRYAVWVGLAADLIGIISAIGIAYLFFR